MLLPKKYNVQSIEQDTHDIFTLTLIPEVGDIPSFLPGQFNMLTHFGFGEIPISISGDPSKENVLIHTIRAVGPVTLAMRKLKKGDQIGVRGPFGTSWPLSRKNCDVLIVAGGLGLAPLRSAIYELLKHRKQFQKITILYGTRTIEDILYQEELQAWKNKGFVVEMTLDQPDIRWGGPVGFVTSLIPHHLTQPENTIAFVCGPEIMMKVAAKELLNTKVREESIYLSMERNMKCAVGCCGHCQMGPIFICKDGPIFSYNQLKNWLTIKEL